MNREALATALVLVAVASGESIEGAIERAGRVFGESSVTEVNAAIEQSAWASAPRASKVQIAMLQQRSRRRSSVFALIRYLIIAAFGLTMAALAFVVPSSAEIGLAGW